MSADLHAAAWLADGGDLAAAGCSLNHDGNGLWDSPTEEIGTPISPGFDSALDTGSRFPPYTRSVMYTVRGTGFASVWAGVLALRRRCKPGKSVTLTQVVPDPEGSAANVNLATVARRQTDRVSWLSDIAAVVDIDWLITGGPFYGSSVNIASAAGTTSVKGDVRTRRMTITLAAGAARTVTNTTNGFALTFSATVPTGGVLVDVEARTAHAITGGSDLSASLTWTKVHPFQLDAGSNTITVSAGTASIDYQPAYL